MQKQNLASIELDKIELEQNLEKKRKIEKDEQEKETNQLLEIERNQQIHEETYSKIDIQVVQTNLETIPIFEESLMFNIQIRDKFYNSLFDNGAEACIMESKFYRLNFRQFPLEKFDMNVSTANGSTLQARGISYIPVKIGDQTKRIPFIISDLSTHNIIIGLNACKTYNLIPDYQKRRIYCGNYSTKLKQKPQIARIFTAAKDIILPPGKEALIPLDLVDSTFKSKLKNKTVIITDKSQVPGIYSNCGGIIDLQAKSTHNLWTGNFTKNEVKIHKGMVLAKISCVLSVNSIEKSKKQQQLDKLVEKIQNDPKIPSPVQGKIAEFFQKYSDVFGDLKDIPKAGLPTVLHRILLKPGSWPFYSRLRRHSATELEIIKNH